MPEDKANHFGPVEGAAMARLESGRTINARILIVTNPNRQGVDYVDLGDLSPGTYIVSIAAPMWGTSTAILELVVR